MREVIYRNHRGQALWGIFAGIVILPALGVGLYLGVRHEGLRSAGDYALAGIVGFIMLCVAALFVGGLRRLADATPQLAVKHAGLDGIRCRVGAIPWNDIRRIQLHVHRTRGWVDHAELEISRFSVSRPLLVDIAGLDATPEAITLAACAAAKAIRRANELQPIS